MDYFGQLVLLGFDAILFGYTSKLYYDTRKAVGAVKGLSLYEISAKTKKVLKNNIPDRSIPYCAIRGLVKALGSPIRSQNVPDTYGVVQKLTVKEHVVSKGAFGFWNEHERVIQVSLNDVPFILQIGKNDVEIVEPLAAQFLELETVSDTFEPKSVTFMDFVWGFFMGTRERGYQRTEEMLREGTLLTGIGELVLSEDNKMLRLQPPTNNMPYFLTPVPLSTLTKKLEEQKTVYKYLSVFFGVAGVALIGTVAYQWWTKRQEMLLEEKKKAELERTRRERRSKARENRPLTENELCVVCRVNPKEVIVLPCGHVCLCEDCSDNVKDACPICRTEIQSKSAAYL